MRDGSVYSQFRGIEQGSVRRAHQRGRAAPGIAGIARLDIGQHRRQIAPVAAAHQFGVAAPGTNDR